MLYSQLRKISAFVKVFLILSATACQTLSTPNDQEKKASDILETQKGLVIGYLNQGLPNMALRELRPLEKANPKDADIKNLLGLVFLSLKNPKVAQTHFEEAYVLDQKPAIALNLSSALIENGKPAQAIQLLKDLKKKPAGKDYQYPERLSHNMGLAAERMKKPAQAEQYYKLALQDNPYYYISLMRLGQLYEQNKKMNLAHQNFQRAREACHRCFDPVQAAVGIQLRAGKPALALKTLNEFLSSKEISEEDRVKAQSLLSRANTRNQQAKARTPQPLPRSTQAQGQGQRPAQPTAR